MSGAWVRRTRPAPPARGRGEIDAVVDLPLQLDPREPGPLAYSPRQHVPVCRTHFTLASLHLRPEDRVNCGDMARPRDPKPSPRPAPGPPRHAGGRSLARPAGDLAAALGAVGGAG